MLEDTNLDPKEVDRAKAGQVGHEEGAGFPYVCTSGENRCCVTRVLGRGEW